VVLLTGASRGLGAALARAFAAEGCHLCLVARSALDLTHTQAECQAASRGHAKVITLVADVCNDEECARVVAQCRSVLGPCDILVNNGASARACMHACLLLFYLAACAARSRATPRALRAQRP
jgi:short-subunit dehydrogenase